MNCTIFEKTEVNQKATEYGMKLNEKGLCEIVKDSNYCITFKAPARTRFNIFMPGLILQGKELTVYKDSEGYLHLDKNEINAEYLLESMGLRALMTIELMDL